MGAVATLGGIGLLSYNAAMPRIKDQAICIRHLDWSETSQVVVLLTQTHGKVRGLAKGSKRASPSSVQRFSGGIGLLTLGQVVAVIRPSAELAAVTEWDLQNDFHHLKQNLHAQQWAMYAADVCHAMLADHDPHPRMFDALSAFLTDLNERSPAAALLRFQWVALEDGGYRPELWRDVETGETLHDQPTYQFNALAGGLTTNTAHESPRETSSRRQPNGGAESWGVRRETVELLRNVARHTQHTREHHSSTCEWDAANPQAIQRANRLLCAYLKTILDRELPTMRFVT